MKKLHAFTLIELLITLSLFSILSMLALTSFNTISHQIKNQLASSQLLHIIQTAKDQARLRGIPIVFSLKKEGGYHIFLNEERDGILHDAHGVIASFYENQNKLYFRSYPRYRNYLLFSPEQQENDNSSFWYCAGAHFPEWAITLSKSGRTRLILPDAKGHINNRHGSWLTCDAANASTSQWNHFQ